MSSAIEEFLSELAALTLKHNLIVATFGEVGRVQQGFCVYQPLPDNGYRMKAMRLDWDAEKKEYTDED